ncbi:MAG: glutamate--cysteine ligase [Isosphaeraceae bacterium]
MDAREHFRRNDWPTLGVEVELQLVDARTMALRSAIAEVLGELPVDLHEFVKPEFMQCYVEVNTGICRTVDDVANDLRAKIGSVEHAADRRGVGLVWAATHPFSSWREQEITPQERYYALANLLQETVTRPVTFGMHVHVGVESGDRAIGVINSLQRYLPLLLALSANSPFWHQRRTGHHAHRIEVLEGLPTGGLPPRMDSWNEYVALLGQLKEAGFIESPKEVWWDARPCAETGTVEVRICDMPSDLSAVVGLTALIQCLIHHLSQEIGRGEVPPECHPLIVRQNRWRACRFGLGAALVEPVTLEPVPARLGAERLMERLRGVADGLGCRSELESFREMVALPNGAERQLAFFEETGDLVEVVRRLLQMSRLTQGLDPLLSRSPGQSNDMMEGSGTPDSGRSSVHRGAPAA